MRDIERAIRTAYYTLLNGIDVDGKEIPFFDKHAPSRFKPPYIIWSGLVQGDWNNKDHFGGDVSVDLYVYQEELTDWGSSIQADEITNKVVHALTNSPGHNAINPAGLNVITTKVRAIAGEFIHGETKITYRKRITVEHLVEILP